MAKYSFEFKMKVVTEYLNGEGGYVYLAKKHSINQSLIEKWIRNYKEFGEKGLARSRQNKKYTFEYKLHMVELYLTTEVSYRELAIQEGISNNSMIANWVRYYRAAGPDGLRPSKRGRKKTLSTDKKDVKLETKENSAKDNKFIYTSAEHVKELEDELLKLRIEEAAFRGRSKNERTARIISSLRGQFKLKDLLSYTNMPKATYMYWQKRLDRENPDQKLEEKMLEIKEANKDYGYRRMQAELRNQGIVVNKKKVQRIM